MTPPRSTHRPAGRRYEVSSRIVPVGATFDLPANAVEPVLERTTRPGVVRVTYAQELTEVPVTSPTGADEPPDPGRRYVQ